jgi:hypothetical protein
MIADRGAREKGIGNRKPCPKQATPVLPNVAIFEGAYLRSLFIITTSFRPTSFVSPLARVRSDSFPNPKPLAIDELGQEFTVRPSCVTKEKDIFTPGRSAISLSDIAGD